MGSWQFPTDVLHFCHVILKKMFFLSEVIVSVYRWRKDIKVTFVSFGLHVRRFTVACKNIETRYFDIFIYFWSNFTLYLRIYRESAVSHRLAASYLIKIRY